MAAACVAIVSIIWIYRTSDIARNSADSLINPSALRLGNIDEGSSEYYRFALAKGILDKMYGYRWLVGFGPGTFFLADVGSKYAGHEHTLTAADSHFLKLLFEHGLLGLAAFIVLLVVIIRNALRAVRPSKQSFNRSAAAATCAISCFIIENFTVSMFLLLPLTLLFWLNAGLVLPVHPASSSRYSANQTLGLRKS